LSTSISFLHLIYTFYISTRPFSRAAGALGGRPYRAGRGFARVLHKELGGINRSPGPLDECPSVAYNIDMIFIETPVFTKRILDAMSDDEYAAL